MQRCIAVLLTAGLLLLLLSVEAATKIDNAIDTFELCHIHNNNRSDVDLKDLVKAFGLPRLSHPVTLEEVVQSLKAAWPNAQLAKLYAPPSDILGIAASVTNATGSHIHKTHGSNGSALTPFPRLIHITVPSINHLRPFQAVTIASWLLLNPGYTLLIYGDAQVRGTVERHFPWHLKTLDELPTPVERTDLWRYLALCAFGGVYADSDVICARPVDSWVDTTHGDAGLLVGIENAFTTPEEAAERTYARQIQLEQWLIAGRPGHPATCRMGDYVQQHVQLERRGFFNISGWDTNRAVLERTGPGIWTTSVSTYLEQQGVELGAGVLSGVRAGDLRLLPQLSFGCPSMAFDLAALDRTLKAIVQGGGAAVFAQSSSSSSSITAGAGSAPRVPYVYHQFMGTWKQDEDGWGAKQWILLVVVVLTSSSAIIFAVFVITSRTRLGRAVLSRLRKCHLPL
mmetsp:Transcript_19235/g.41558  ORF Transcript_19235/g.41558 Transcript_19235/m.41558 type:complete len:455 (+) Transcript_19235:54-1418(+)